MNDEHSIPTRPAREGPSLEALARAGLQGDEAAFRAMVDCLLPDAMALAIQFVRRRQDAEDVVQEAFLRLARSLPTYDPSRRFAPWFFTIVRNCCRDHRVRAARSAPNEHAAEADGSGPGADGLALDLGRAVEALPEVQRRCVRLCLVEGYTSAEAALLLGLRDGTVRTHVQRARKRLRALFDDAGGVA